MRILDQIDPSAGALRSWQPESERLVFDQRAGASRVQGGAGGDGGCQSAERPPRLLDRSPPRRRSIIRFVRAADPAAILISAGSDRSEHKVPTNAADSEFTAVKRRYALNVNKTLYPASTLRRLQPTLHFS